jgi:cobalt/nickel transport protein
MTRIPTKVVLATGLLVALLLAGIISFYASGSPDGLERVAEDKGFLERADEHAAADGPLADYQARGVENDRIAGGVAGVTGAVVVLLVMGGLTYVVRRREPSSTNRD